MDNEESLIVLDQKILYQNGNYRRVRRYLKGMHPSRGVISKGLTGWETIEEIDLFVPVHVFRVIE